MLSVAELEHSSLRKEVLNAIGNFLLMENFKMPNVGIVKDEILNIIDLISDYYEEGKPLIFSNIRLFVVEVQHLINKDIWQI